MGKLEGKVALVTGAGRGIGRGIALELAREGAAVVIAELNPYMGGVRNFPGLSGNEGNL